MSCPLPVVCVLPLLWAQDMVDVVRNGMPSQTFDEMMAVLRKFVSFMNFTVSPACYNTIAAYCCSRVVYGNHMNLLY